MNRNEARSLVELLTSHPEVARIRSGSVDFQYFVTMLASVPTDGEKFRVNLPENGQTLDTDSASSGRYQRLSIDCVLVNEELDPERPGRLGLAYGTLASLPKIHSPNLVFQTVIADEALRRMIEESKGPFSAIAMLKSYDFDNPDQTLYVAARPLLIIPNGDPDYISKWEQRNTRYGMEVGPFPLRSQVRISHNGYLRGIGIQEEETDGAISLGERATKGARTAAACFVVAGFGVALAFNRVFEGGRHGYYKITGKPDTWIEHGDSSFGRYVVLPKATNPPKAISRAE